MLSDDVRFLMFLDIGSEHLHDFPTFDIKFPQGNYVYESKTHRHIVTLFGEGAHEPQTGFIVEVSHHQSSFCEGGEIPFQNRVVVSEVPKGALYTFSSGK